MQDSKDSVINLASPECDICLPQMASSESVWLQCLDKVVDQEWQFRQSSQLDEEVDDM